MSQVMLQEQTLRDVVETRSPLGDVLSQERESGRGNVIRREAEVVKHRGEEEKRENEWEGTEYGDLILSVTHL